MRRVCLVLITALGLAGCNQQVEKTETHVSAPAPDSLEGRAKRQLESRLGADVALSDLRTGTEGDKPILCGQASVGGAAPRPFALRNGFLILPEDAGPAAFAQLQSACTEPAA